MVNLIYPQWQVRLIKLITEDEPLSERIRLNLIRCIVHDEMRDSYDMGYSPEEEFQVELMELRSSDSY